MANCQSQWRTVPTLAIFALAAILALSAHAQAQEPMHSLQPRLNSQAATTFGNALREVLSERGLDRDQLEEIIFALEERLVNSRDFSASKRAGWKRIPIQTRFAPFGTKLVPSRNRGESNGPTLLRYGRSSS